jgi:hypothetical protein
MVPLFKMQKKFRLTLAVGLISHAFVLPDSKARWLPCRQLRSSLSWASIMA